MTSHGGPAVMGGAAGKSDQPEPDAVPQPRRYDAGPAWMRWAPPLAMLAVGLISITTPSYWRDEAATLAAVRRPLGEMFTMMGHVDAVHGAYYLLAWADYRIGGHTELFMRFPSVVAMCVAAGFVAALGRRLVSPAAGLLAGLAFVILPQVSFYAQDARSVAFETAMAAIASYLLIRALDAPERTAGGRGPVWWWTCYALGIGLLGILNIFALLLVPAHLATVAAACWRSGRGRTRWVTARRWAASAAAGLVIASPLLYLGFTQKGQVSWLKVPDWLNGVNQLVGPMVMLYGALLTVAAGIVVAAIGGRARLRACWPAGLNQLALPWLILPPALLLLGSLITPVYTFRYIMFCTPAVALILGAALAAIARLRRPHALGPVLAAAVLLAVAALGLNSQLAERKPDGHKDNLRRVDRLIGQLRRPGDVVYYTNTNSESFPWAYPYGLIKIPNVELARQPIASGTLAGTNAPEGVVRQRLGQVDRVWVVNMNTNHIAVPILYGLRFHLVHTYRVSDIWLRLYIKRGSGAPIPKLPSS